MQNQEERQMTQEEVQQFFLEKDRKLARLKDCRACGEPVKVGVLICPHCTTSFPTSTNMVAGRTIFFTTALWLFAVVAIGTFITACEMRMFVEMLK